MTLGSKRVENRGWSPPRELIGGYIALHAGKTWDDEGAAFIRRCHPEMPGSAGDHPLGVVGVGRLVRVVQTADELDDAPDQQRWLFGEFGWLLADVVAFKAVPCRGAQKLWRMPDPVLSVVRERYTEARRAA